MAMNSFKKMIMMANQIDYKPSLPKEYVQLEWLGSDSSAYIDTGIGGDYNNFTIDVQFTYNQYVRYGAVYGNYVEDNTNSWRCILAGVNNYVIVCCNTIGTTSGNTTIPCRISDIHILKTSQSLITIDNITSTPKKSYGISNNNNIILFNRGNNITIRDIGLKIYYFKIYDDENIILNLIPALRIADSKPGMYDLVTGQFFVNQGTGEFAYSTEIFTQINTILESIITGEELDNMDSLLQQISQSQEDMSLINTQLENIINT